MRLVVVDCKLDLSEKHLIINNCIVMDLFTTSWVLNILPIRLVEYALPDLD